MGSIVKFGKRIPAKGGIAFMFRIKNDTGAEQKIVKFLKDIKSLNLHKLPGYHAMSIEGHALSKNKPILSVTVKIGTDVDDKRVIDNFLQVMRPTLRDYNGYIVERTA